MCGSNFNRIRRPFASHRIDGAGLGLSFITNTTRPEVVIGMPKRDSGDAQAALKRGSKRKQRADGPGSSSNQDKPKNQGATGMRDTFDMTPETSRLSSSLYWLGTGPEHVTPSPSKRPRQSGSLNTPGLALSSPATPLTLKALGLTPDRANLLSKHGRKVKTFVPLTLAASKEVLALGREPTGAEFAEILVRNVERMVRFF